MATGSAWPPFMPRILLRENTVNSVLTYYILGFIASRPRFAVSNTCNIVKNSTFDSLQKTYVSSASDKFNAVKQMLNKC